MNNTKAYAAQSSSSPMKQASIQRRDPGAQDVQIEILFCGVCHSDLHQVRNEWQGAMPTVYPCVPGHEIVGRVTKTGNKVKKFKDGDIVAVGCMVDSDRTCVNCREGEEQFCEGGATFTYNSEDKHLGGVTYGGYSENIVVDEAFVLQIPARLDLASAAPLLCAGITTYSPLRNWNVHEGQNIGVVGLGGLGHMAVKFANAFGAHVSLFTTSPNKTEDAKRLGAHEVVISKDPEEFTKRAGTFDFIIDTVSAKHDLSPYINLLKKDSTMVLVGAPEHPLPVASFDLIFGRRRLSGSPIGGIRQTQEMLNFCADHNIACDIELINIQQINDAYERLLKSDVKYRFVIDMASLKNQ